MVSLKTDFSVLQPKRMVPHGLTTGSHEAHVAYNWLYSSG